MAPTKTGIDNKELYDYRENKAQKSLMSQKSLPGRMKASIRLSNQAAYIDIERSIEQVLPDFECKRQGNVIVVSGDPPRNGFVAGDILDIVRRHDHHATLNN